MFHEFVPMGGSLGEFVECLEFEDARDFCHVVSCEGKIYIYI